jgi:thiol-disulfide isomerase/thioredoxin
VKILFKITFVVLLLIGAGKLFSQEIPVFEKFTDFEHLLHKNNDTTYILNFWATWCKPCVTELPEFEKINQQFKHKKFKMILVSLDFESQLDSKVRPFIKEKNMQANVVLLADTKENSWIDKVDKEWSGSIPATIIYNSNFNFFKEGSMTYEELKEIISKNIKK